MRWNCIFSQHLVLACIHDVAFLFCSTIHRKSLKRFDVFTIAMGSLLLASKVEECFKTLREVSIIFSTLRFDRFCYNKSVIKFNFTAWIIVCTQIIFAFHHIYAHRKGLRLRAMELGGQQYTEWKGELITIERYILKELGFSLYNIMDHPHKYILYFVKVLNGSEELANAAWAYLNDSMRLDVSLKYPAQTIACAAIFLASRKIGFPLPEGGDEISGSVGSAKSASASSNVKGCWWEVMSADKETMLLICDEILSLYHADKVSEADL